MGRSVFVLCGVLIYTCSLLAQQQAFGDIYYGMSEKQVKHVYKKDREKYQIVFGDFYLRVSVANSNYDDSGLYSLTFFAIRKDPLKEKMDLDQRKLLMDIKSLFNNSGYSDVDINSYWPNPESMVGDPHAIIMHSPKMGKYAVVNIPFYQNDIFYVYLKLFSEKYLDEMVGLNEKKIDMGTEDIKSTLQMLIDSIVVKNVNSVIHKLDAE